MGTDSRPLRLELLRLQVIADVGAGGKVVVIDSDDPAGKAPAGLAGA